MRDLREFTTARVGLGAAGDSLPTRALLELRMAHAKARDAVRWPLSFEDLRGRCRERGWASVVVESAARDREEYLRRPDLGRVLGVGSELPVCEDAVVFIVGDGLSALAVERHALPLLEVVFRLLGHAAFDGNPVVLVKQARVAIGDEIGFRMGAAVSVLLIGERPGLSSPDSLGVYLTYAPRPGRTDAERNCLSNIHGAGLSYELAAHKILFLIGEMRRRGLSGVGLKETAGAMGLGRSQKTEVGDRPTD